MTLIQSAHKETVNCGSNYGRAKNWFDGATQAAEVDGLYGIVFDGKAFFYDPEFFANFDAFGILAISAFSIERCDFLTIQQRSANVIELA